MDPITARAWKIYNNYKHTVGYVRMVRGGFLAIGPAGQSLHKTLDDAAKAVRSGG